MLRLAAPRQSPLTTNPPAALLPHAGRPSCSRQAAACSMPRMQPGEGPQGLFFLWYVFGSDESHALISYIKPIMSTIM
jgi:hypothetical protein